MPSVATDDDLARLAGKVVSGRYTLEQLISGGAFGAVFRATDKQFPASPVAIKVARSPLMEKTGSLFEREARLLRMLDHPNVVRVYDYGFWEEHAFIVMAFLEGETLKELFKRYEKTLPTKLLLQFVREIGTALEYAHANNAVHRDLKPENVFLVTSRDSLNRDGQLSQRFVLLDFGIATKFDDSGSLANKTVAGLGTPEYRSPEQIHSCRETPLDENPSTDIYTFGVLLYQLLTGRLPFRMEKGTVLEFARVTQEIVKQPPPTLSEVAPDRRIKPEIEALVLQCLEKEPAKRPRSIGEVRDRFLKCYQPPPVKPVPKRSGTLTPHSEGESGVSLVRTPKQELRSVAVPALKPGNLPRILGATAFVAAVLVVVALQFRKIEPPSFFAPVAGPKLLNDQLMVSAVKPDELTIIDVPSEWNPDKVKVAFPALESSESYAKGLIHVVRKPNKGGKQLSITYTIKVEPDLPPEERHVTAVISNGDAAVTNLEFSLSVNRPIWMPADTAKRRFSGRGNVVVCHGQMFYSRLICDDQTIKNAGGPDLVFCLIKTNEEKPFYMMRDEVWVGLYFQFDPAAKSKFPSTEIGTSTNAFPMRFIVPSDAIGFSKWLLGDLGDLPTREEWWTAADYSPNKKSETSGPFVGDGKAGIAFNRNEPVPVGTSPNDFVKTTGCRDMAGNVSEWTKLPDPPDSFHVEGSSFVDVSLESSWYLEHDEFSAPAKNKGTKHIGFRVVMHVPKSIDSL